MGTWMKWRGYRDIHSVPRVSVIKKFGSSSGGEWWNQLTQGFPKSTRQLDTAWAWYSVIPRYIVKCKANMIRINLHGINPRSPGVRTSQPEEDSSMVSAMPCWNPHSFASPSSPFRVQGCENHSIGLLEQLSAEVWAVSPEWEIL